MTRRNTTPWVWPYAATLAVVATIAAAQWLDASAVSIEAHMDAERREWAAAVTVCHRAFGPSTAPEYDERGLLVCVSRRGERLAPVSHAAHAAGQVPAAGVKVARQ